MVSQPVATPAMTDMRRLPGGCDDALALVPLEETASRLRQAMAGPNGA